MKTEDLERLTLQELHRLALETCAPRFRKRICGIMTGHRRFLLALLGRCDREETYLHHSKKGEAGV